MTKNTETPTPCPATKYGSAMGLSDPVCSGDCAAGYDGSKLGSTSSTCGGECQAGYFCGREELPSECGSANKYCPLVSSVPLFVDANHYSTPMLGNTSLRSGQKICDDGHQCDLGVMTACVAGEYCKEGVKTSCTTATHYCPAESPGPLAVSTGHYSSPEGTNNPRVSQTKCEAGYFCVNGVRSKCGSAARFSKEGKNVCSDVQSGFYSTPETASANGRTGESVCPRGHFCIRGNKFKCPGGT